MTRYKLAFAVARYFSFGGMQRTLSRMARECAHRGHDVHMFTGDLQGERPPEVPVHILPLRALSNHGRYREFAQKLDAAVQGEAFDCVVGSTKGPGLDVYYAGDPCYVAKVDENRSSFYKFLPRYRALRELERSVFSANADTEILLIAHREREKFMYYYGTQAARFHLLPPGIDKQRLVEHVPSAQERDRLREELGVSSDDYLLLNVGSRFQTKGIDRILIALAALPDKHRRHTKLAVVGGDDPGPFLRLARRLGVIEHVRFTGAREDVAAFYHAADLLIHPAYTENTGTTVIEAMICGLPVLATANCGFAFHVETAGAGLVCPSPYEQEQLNHLLRQMLVAERLADWRSRGPVYCANTDLYSLIEKAADIIITRAERRRAEK